MRAYLTALALTLLAALQIHALGDIKLDTPKDLGDQYFNIFKTGNRNAASHLWASFVLERAGSMPSGKVGEIFRGFCAVSGSPIPDDPHTMYKVTLPKVGGGTVTGVARHCCWPCICDMNEHVRVDTKTINTADGAHAMEFLVIGDPCSKAHLLAQSFMDPFSGTNTSLGHAAPELRCEGDKLAGAVFSDHGHPIIGMLFTDSESLDAVPELPAPHQKSAKTSSDPTFGYGEMCSLRRAQGYNSGMGLIFHLVARIAPIDGTAALPLPSPDPAIASKLVQQVETAPKVALNTREPLAPSSSAASAATLAMVAAATLAGIAVMTLWRGRRAAGRQRLQGELE
mmetsp:Transcript_42126/g.106009  ORF Transcript_42126/g.106009 Transcript_42126/m.106009 type:complete len:341 (+) Transcript_42126:38-1060(+)